MGGVSAAGRTEIPPCADYQSLPPRGHSKREGLVEAFDIQSSTLFHRGRKQEVRSLTPLTEESLGAGASPVTTLGFPAVELP